MAVAGRGYADEGGLVGVLGCEPERRTEEKIGRMRWVVWRRKVSGGVRIIEAHAW